jgi:hypothetical protein
VSLAESVFGCHFDGCGWISWKFEYSVREQRTIEEQLQEVCEEKIKMDGDPTKSLTAAIAHP